ncbi:MAG: tRNA (adenosine(37)-N6)-threonylcarbamoyltransferase complex ATPase subunit type 1 TsaE [Patescibacteria group bacterium]|nr:tRNA (adenosine(37)-N6)-threonylcarbamoyltransferase complex ATPase subunit type 1 TsaE [Patescibacteria group bacterium]MDD5164602.1 tRNA (adenosine(37)-N6)-threonylcarbamoyltransferase complex ATPase subunit type 1 TsaE [Patescibacteria group bacterium]MDD5534357.1 tRNA (adenosine(37)-N6)-threonylcarbamoyltransferase complex ATPase subunit type 1 TsaE [Patescibacteria group bacterium]
MKKIITHSEKQTLNLGKKIAKKLVGGEVLALNGELGSGKTVLIKGIAAELGIKKHITSPTFVVMKIYSVKSLKICHIDAYRLNSGQDLINIGVKDWSAKPNTVTVIEWAERVKNILPKDTITIKLKLGKKKNERIITVNNNL